MRAEEQILRRVSLRELRVLAAAVAWGSAAKAARELGLTQPAVSKAIAALENAVGAQLLERRASGVEPTPAGRLLLSRATNVFDELKQAAREIELLADPRGGELSVGSGAGLSAGLLPAVLGAMLERRPASRHLSIEADEGTLIRHILGRRLDIALGRAVPAEEEPELHFEPLFNERLLVVVPLGHPLATRRGLKLSDLMDARWIMAAGDSYVGRIVQRAFEQQGLPVPRACITTMSVLARFELLASGEFVTTLPESLLRFSRTHPTVAILPIEPLASTPVGVLRLKRRAVSPVAQLFIDCARELTAKLKPLDSAALARLARRSASARTYTPPVRS